jgi:3-methyladenine DNA glycosylase AlkD
MQLVKRRLYAMRNGIVADSLRKGGCPHRLIFGVNLPQLAEIAAKFGPNTEVAEALRADRDLRESALLAPMLYPVGQLTIEEARKWVAEAMWSEDVDILCFKLLKKAAFARQLAGELVAADASLMRYAGLRLYFNIVSQCPEQALSAAEAELKRADALSSLASMLAEEARFIME